MFFVTPNENSNTFIMMYNGDKYITYPDTDDEPLPTYSEYVGGQTITGFQGWYGRWVTVKCVNVQEENYSQVINNNGVTYDVNFKPRLQAPTIEDGGKYYTKRYMGGIVILLQTVILNMKRGQVAH